MDPKTLNEKSLKSKCINNWSSAIRRFTNILDLAPLGLKSLKHGNLVPARDDELGARETDDEIERVNKEASRARRARNIASSETYQLEVEAAALVRAAEDMLSLNNSLKQLWFYGKLDTLGESTAEAETEGHARVVAELLPKTVNRL